MRDAPALSWTTTTASSLRGLLTAGGSRADALSIRAVTMPDLPVVPARYTDPPLARAFRHGWEDASMGRSDFVRRSYSGEARAAYMSGRVAWHARKVLAKP